MSVARSWEFYGWRGPCHLPLQRRRRRPEQLGADAGTPCPGFPGTPALLVLPLNTGGSRALSCLSVAVLAQACQKGARSGCWLSWLRARGQEPTATRFLCRAVRRPVGHADARGPPGGHDLRGPAAAPGHRPLRGVDSVHPFGHGRAFCISPRHTPPLVSLTFSFGAVQEPTPCPQRARTCVCVARTKP